MYNYYISAFVCLIFHQCVNVTCVHVVFREASPNLVSFGGVVKGESAMTTEEEIGGLINYAFRVG